MKRFPLYLLALLALLSLAACDAGGDAEGLAPGTFEAVVTGAHERRLEGTASFRFDGPAGPAFSLSLKTGTLPGLPDSLRVPRDSLFPFPDSLFLPADSLFPFPDSLYRPRDSLVVPDSFFTRDLDTGVFFGAGGPGRPSAGTYPVAFLPPGGFFGHILLTTRREEPLFFLAEQGEVTITASSAERMSGTFTFTALGRGVSLEEEAVEVTGSFVALPE